MSFTHRIDTPTKKYEGWIRGERRETTSTSEGKAKVQMARAYNNEYGFRPEAFQEITGFAEIPEKEVPPSNDAPTSTTLIESAVSQGKLFG